ncbi:MAG: hypothetical protein ABEK50_15515 [bacterium]
MGNLTLVGVYQLGDIYGYLLFRGLIVLFAALVVHSIIDFDTHPFWLLTLVFFAFCLIQKTHMRTAIFSIPFTTLLMWLWFKYYYQGQSKLLYGIPIVFLFWSNIHGSYIVGVGFLILLVLGALVNRLFRVQPGVSPIKFLLILLLTLGIVTYVKPFPDHQAYNKAKQTLKRSGSTLGLIERSQDNKQAGRIQSYFFAGTFERTHAERVRKRKRSSVYRILKTVLRLPFDSGGQFQSAEFAFPYQHPKFIFVRAGFLIASVSLLVFLLAPAPFRCDLFLALLGSLLLGLGYLRTVSYVALVTVPVMFIRFQIGDYKNWLTNRLSVTSSLASLLAVWILAGNILFLIYINDVKTLTGNPHHELGFNTISRFDPAAAERVLKHDPRARYFNTYNIGSFLIWKWWPYKRVFFDSKFSAFKPEFQRRVTRGALPRILDDYQLQHAITETGSYWAIRYFLRAPYWEVTFGNKAHLTFRHKVASPDS